MPSLRSRPWRRDPSKLASGKPRAVHIVALPLICRSSYRGVVEFLRDLLGLPVSLGYVVRPNGAVHQWRKEPPRELSVGSGS